MEEGRFSGSCDSGYSCAYSNTISWRSPNLPNPKDTRPKALFERLFGPLGGDPNADANRTRRKSLLDLVLTDTKDLMGKLGSEDKVRLGSYLDSVRSLEQQLAALDGEQDGTKPPADFLARDRGDYGARLDLMYEMIRLALLTEKTRVITFMLGNAGSNRSYRSIGVPEGHHDLSHHGKKEHNISQIRKINRFQMEAFGRFAASLKSTAVPGGNLLNSCIVQLGSGLADGDRHSHDDLPIILLGTGGGRIRSGRHLRYRKDTPMANLYLELLGLSGSKLKSFGDSNDKGLEIRS
jgi:hypothetical protein